MTEKHEHGLTQILHHEIIKDLIDDLVKDIESSEIVDIAVVYIMPDGTARTRWCGNEFSLKTACDVLSDDLFETAGGFPRQDKET